MPYPPSLPVNFANNTAIVDVHPGAHNDTNQAIMDMAGVLGSSPQGVFADVATRLNSLSGNTVITLAALDTPTAQRNRADILCTGTNDDITIQNALNSLPSSGGKLIFLNGTFNMQSGTVNIGSRSKVLFEGQGEGTVFRAGNASNMHMFSSSSPSASQIIFRNFTIDGNNTNNTSNGQGIRFSGAATDIIIENIFFTNTLAQPISVNGSRFWIVNNICRNTTAGIILNAGATDCWLIGNDIISTGAAPTTFDAISNQGTRNKFFYNKCSSSDTGINLSGDGHIVIGNHCYLNGNSGINSGGGVHLIIMGNVCFANGRKTNTPRSNAGIRVRDHTSTTTTTTDAIISNNVCYDDTTTYPLSPGAVGQIYNIEVVQVAAHGIPDWLIITNNVLRNPAPTGQPLQLTNVGSNCQIHDNLGVVGGIVSGGAGSTDFTQSFLFM